MNEKTIMFDNTNLDLTLPYTDTDMNGKRLALFPLLKQALTDKSSKPLVEIHLEGMLKPLETEGNYIEQFENFMLDKRGRLVHAFMNYDGELSTRIYLFEDGVVDYTLFGADDRIDLTAVSFNQEMLNELREMIEFAEPEPAEQGQVYCIVKSGYGLQLQTLGNASIQLTEENYTPEVIKGYRHIVRDLKSDSPSGRVAILRGEAGSGKTHIVRGLLSEVPDAMFVLISPGVITDLSSPELLPLLMNAHRRTDAPIVIILEDADHCLVERDNSNINSIQSLLNLGDGILGSMLDIRIIATTNADEFQMDKAIMRPGRLSKMLDVGALDNGTARKVFNRLVYPNYPSDVRRLLAYPEELSDKSKSLTLAEVYALARQNGYTPPARKSTT